MSKSGSLGSGGAGVQNSNEESLHRVLAASEPEVLVAKRPELRVRAPLFTSDGNFTYRARLISNRSTLGRFVG